MGVVEVVDFFEMAGPFDFYAHHQAAIQVETARGRARGPIHAVLLDCPWSALQFFKRAKALA